MFPLTTLQSKITTSKSIREVQGPVSDACIPNTPALLDSLFNRLQRSQMSQLMYGREVLRTMTIFLVTSVLQLSVGYCKGCYGGKAPGDRLDTSCASKARDWYAKQRDILFSISPYSCGRWLNDPLRGFTLLKMYAERMSASADGVCSGCSSDIVKIIAALRRYIWDELPYIFLLKARDSERVYGYASYMYVHSDSLSLVNRVTHICCLILTHAENHSSLLSREGFEG